MPFEIIRDDLTRVHADAIVNAANSALQQGGGVCGAIFAAAGAEKLQRACDAIGHCPVGEAVLTDGFALPARFIIHTVGPVWRGGAYNEEKLLADCYTHSLSLAKDHQLESVAFPLISSGIYRFLKDKALTIATSAISAFLAENEMQVFLVVFDDDAFALSEQRFSSVRQYIDKHYIKEHDLSTGRVLREAELAQYNREDLAQYNRDNRAQHDGDKLAQHDRDESDPYSLQKHEEVMESPQANVPRPMASRPNKGKRSLEHLVEHLDESFSQMLLRLIDAKGRTDVETYKRANLDRKLFSKIRSDRYYKVSKPTALALAIALELNLDETRDLLAKAGFALSHSSKFDVIVEYFIKEGTYDIFEINETLFAFDQVLLGASMSLAMRPE